MCLDCVWLRRADAGRPGTQLKLPLVFWDDIKHHIGRIGPAEVRMG